MNPTPTDVRGLKKSNQLNRAESRNFNNMATKLLLLGARR
jgi:hypothetical protein